jgi:hypothetical protein
MRGADESQGGENLEALKGKAIKAPAVIDSPRDVAPA